MNDLQKNNYIQRLIILLIEVIKDYNFTLMEEYNRSVLDEDQYVCKDAIELIEEITGENIKEKFDGGYQDEM